MFFFFVFFFRLSLLLPLFWNNWSAVICAFGSFQAYLWDNNQSVVEWLEKHLSKEDGGKSAIRENIKYLKRENALKHIRRYTVAMNLLFFFKQH